MIKHNIKVYYYTYLILDQSDTNLFVVIYYIKLLSNQLKRINLIFCFHFNNIIIQNALN